MSGKMRYCNLPDDSKLSIYDIRETECNSIPGAYWDTYDLNFDNIISGMITLFVLSTLENWPSIMYKFIDGDETGPMYDNYVAFTLYFVFFILIGSFFLLNLFVGVISLSYSIASKNAKSKILTED
jgi:hypothetical protein